jgi:hypothetical protein
MRRFLAFPVAVAALAAAMPSAWAQGLGIHLGGINIDIGGSSGGLGVSVGGTNVSVGGNGVSIGTGGVPGSEGVPAGGGGSGTANGSAGSSDVVELSQQASVDAVHAQRALPLDVILAKARAVTTGQVIDAKLIGYRNFLLYDLKVLATTGDVSELYFYARSGVQVQTR